MNYIFGGTRPDAGPDAAPAPDPVDDADCPLGCLDRDNCAVCGGAICLLHTDAIDCIDLDGPAHSYCHNETCRVCWEQDEAERRGDEIREGDPDPWPGELEPDDS